jgi:hypothetical protein
MKSKNQQLLQLLNTMPPSRKTRNMRACRLFYRLSFWESGVGLDGSEARQSLRNVYTVPSISPFRRFLNRCSSWYYLYPARSRNHHRFHASTRTLSTSSLCLNLFEFISSPVAHNRLLFPDPVALYFRIPRSFDSVGKVTSIGCLDSFRGYNELPHDHKDIQVIKAMRRSRRSRIR